MKTVLKTLGQMLLLTIVAVGIGLTANRVAGKDRIDLSYNYNPDRNSHPGPQPSPDVKVDPQTDLSVLPAPTAAHEFRELSEQQAKVLFDDPKRGLRLHLFVDARTEDTYGQGHIPGATLCDSTRPTYYIPGTANAANQAEKVIVYCNGGDCEDSLLVCRELLNSGMVPWGNIYLFHGGWDAWTKAGYPIEKGPPATAGE